MSTPPERLPIPTHLRPLTVDIPRTWTPEQALAVFELIDDLRDKICAIYNCQVQALLREQCADRGAGDGNANLDEQSFRPARMTKVRRNRHR